jgi:hypothetical protein
VNHLILECRQWTTQRRKLKQELTQAGVIYPLATEEAPEGRLFRDWKATQAILIFIATTGVGVRGGETEREAEWIQRDDEWDLETLDTIERDGEG